MIIRRTASLTRAITRDSLTHALTRALTAPGVGGGAAFIPMSATGGTITDTTIGGRGWRYHTFNSSGTFTVSSIGTDPSVTYLAVGSGASGGHGYYLGSGGGAGGMVRSGTTSPALGAYSIVVGSPGAAVSTNFGNTGGDVTGLGVTAEGGSGGGAYFMDAGNGASR